MNDTLDATSTADEAQLLKTHTQIMSGYLSVLHEQLAAITAAPHVLTARRGVQLMDLNPDVAPAPEELLIGVAQALERLGDPNRDAAEDSFQMIAFEPLCPMGEGTFLIVYRVEQTSETGYAVFDELTASCERISPEQFMELASPKDASLYDRILGTSVLVDITAALLLLTQEGEEHG